MDEEQKLPSAPLKNGHFRFQGFGINIGGSGSGLFIGLMVVLICFIVVLAYRVYQHDHNTAVALAEIKTVLIELKALKGN